MSYWRSSDSSDNNQVNIWDRSSAMAQLFLTQISVFKRLAGWNITVGCFYFRFAGQKEQSPKGMLGAIFKQVVRGLEAVLRNLPQDYAD